MMIFIVCLIIFLLVAAGKGAKNPSNIQAARSVIHYKNELDNGNEELVKFYNYLKETYKPISGREDLHPLYSINSPYELPATSWGRKLLEDKCKDYNITHKDASEFIRDNRLI